MNLLHVFGGFCMGVVLCYAVVSFVEGWRFRRQLARDLQEERIRYLRSSIERAERNISSIKEQLLDARNDGRNA